MKQLLLILIILSLAVPVVASDRISELTQEFQQLEQQRQALQQQLQQVQTRQIEIMGAVKELRRESEQSEDIVN